MISPPPTSTLFPYTTLFRSTRPVPRMPQPRDCAHPACDASTGPAPGGLLWPRQATAGSGATATRPATRGGGTAVLRSEEHTSELQSRRDLVCRLLLEKKKNM